MELSDIKYTEIKTLDNSLLQKYDVKFYGSDRDTYDIIMKEGVSESELLVLPKGFRQKILG